MNKVVNDFNFTGIQNALAESRIRLKEFFADIGMMQKQPWRIVNGKNYSYTSA